MTRSTRTTPEQVVSVWGEYPPCLVHAETLLNANEVNRCIILIQYIQMKKKLQGPHSTLNRLSQEQHQLSRV